MSVPTIVDILSERQSDASRGFDFLADGEESKQTLSFQRLHSRAAAIACELQSRRLSGRTVMLLFRPGLAFIEAFFGCLYAGTIAVPAYPPRPNRSWLRIESIRVDSSPAAILTSRESLAALSRSEALTGLELIVTEDIPDETAAAWRPRKLAPDSLAFLQYTSGSTGSPKGVAVKHQNLLANQQMIALAFGTSDRSAIVSWLPLYHDMGLIGNVIHPVYCGARVLLLSQFAFLQRPLVWLETIAKYRGTVSGAPNFAYDLCVRAIGANDPGYLDLSSWEVAYNGAEPVSSQTLTRFAQVFGRSGFDRRSFFPCYGLAEATLFVAGGPRRGGAVLVQLDAAPLERGIASESSGTGSRAVVGCGKVSESLTIAIVDPTSHHRSEASHVGEIWVSGDSVAAGYWGQPAQSGRVFAAQSPDFPGRAFLRTGDLGFVRNDELFVTGRLKDLIILRGRNHYPQDIERSVEGSSEGFVQGGTAAFSVSLGGTEGLVVVQEVQRAGWDPGEALAAARARIITDHDVEPTAVVLVRKGSIPRTSSGKLQRRACQVLFLESQLPVLAQWRLSDSVSSRKRAPLPLSGEPSELAAWLQDAVCDESDPLPLSTPMSALDLDSLRSAELRAQIEQATALKLPLSLFSSDITLEVLARQISLAHGKSAGIESRAADPPSSGVYPATEGQKALVFLYKLVGANPAYHIARAMHLRPFLLPAFRVALDRVVADNSLLRTSVEILDGDIQLRLHRSLAPEVVVEDAGSWHFDRVRSALAQRVGVPFDIAQGSLIRVHVFSVGHEAAVLLFVLHHVICDHLSLEILFEELLRHYAAARSAVELSTRWKPDCFELVRQQESALTGSQGARLREYWSRQFAGALPVLELPTDRPRLPLPSFRGDRVVFELEEPLSNGIRRLSLTLKVSPFCIFLTAFALVLRRYAGQDEVIVGAAASERAGTEFENAIGYFVNPLPLRIRGSHDQSIEAALRSTSSTVKGALDHQDMPFPVLIRELAPPSVSGHSPIFDVMLVYLQPRRFGHRSTSLMLGTDGPEIDIGDVKIQPCAIAQGWSQFDLTLVVAEGPKFQATIDFNRDLFDRPRMMRLSQHLATTLAFMVAHPQALLAEVSLMSPAERESVLQGFNQSAQPLGSKGYESIHGAFERRVEQFPDATALVSDGLTLSYGELDSKANQLSRYLLRHGVASEEPIGVLLERSFDLVISLLAVLKAGCAFVPLDPSYPAERIDVVTSQARVRLAVTHRRHQSLLPARTRSIRTDDEADIIAREDDSVPVSHFDPRQLAYVMFTSGSTGVPKGVMLQHQGVVNRLLWGERKYAFDERDVFIQKTPVTFDVSVWELFSPLRVGARLVIARSGGHQDSRYLAELAAREQATVLHFVPSLLEYFLNTDGLTRWLSLRLVICSGEALQGSLLERFRNWTSAALHNLYGPTEASIEISAWDCRDSKAGEPIPIGTPIANTELRILDAAGEPVPVGVSGELYLGGIGIARGYVERPALTAERFVPDNFSRRRGSRLYRTGDRARYREDGAVEYLGRLDGQVKVRGVRIEFGEIEAVLRGHAKVREAAVKTWDTPALGQLLTAYIVPFTGGLDDPLLAEELRTHLRRKLPLAMIPSLFIAIEAMPVNASGKLDRRALPIPQLPADGAGSYTKPRSPLEESLAGIVESVLNRRPIGVHDNFFESGGSSLSAIKVQSRINSQYGVDLPLSALFEAPTIESMARSIGIVQSQQIDPAELAAFLDEIEALTEKDER